MNAILTYFLQSSWQADLSSSCENLLNNSRQNEFIRCKRFEIIDEPISREKSNKKLWVEFFKARLVSFNHVIHLELGGQLEMET